MQKKATLKKRHFFSDFVHREMPILYLIFVPCPYLPPCSGYLFFPLDGKINAIGSVADCSVIFTEDCGPGTGNFV